MDRKNVVEIGDPIVSLPKPVPLTSAERARRYRAKKKEMSGDSALLGGPTFRERLIELQMKYDLEHLKVTALENQLHDLRSRLNPAPVVNPLAGQVKALRAREVEQEKIIRALNAEILRLRDGHA